MVCGKGLCPECAVELSRCLTCAGQCAEVSRRHQTDDEASRARLAAQNQQLGELEDRLRKLPTAQGGLFLSALLVLVGVPIMLAGFSASDKFRLGRWLGGILIVMGVIYFFVHRAAMKLVRGPGP
jgi:hypothetical protein